MSKHSTLWTSSTTSPETYSGGPSPHDLKLSWIPSQSNDWPTTPGYFLSDDPTAPGYFLSSFFPVADETGPLLSIGFTAGGPKALERLMGCLLIGAIPSAGLEEALASLKDIFEFWYDQPPPRPRPLASVVHHGVGHVVSVGSRPDLVLVEHEGD